MSKLAGLLTTIAIIAISTGQAKADITFMFTESGGNVHMDSYGVLDTSKLVKVPAEDASWSGVGFQDSSSDGLGTMGDTTMGLTDTAFSFNKSTDLSPWYGMFIYDIFHWTSIGTTQFATYIDNGSGNIPGIMISDKDLVGSLWTPDVKWVLTGTFSSYGLIAGTYRITDALTSESITIQIGPETTAVPEPETYAMFLAGLGLMGFVSRRRKSA